MSERISPDDAIRECLALGAQGISLGLAKQLQSERDGLRSDLAAVKKTLMEEENHSKQLHGIALRHKSERDAARAALEEMRIILKKMDCDCGGEYDREGPEPPPCYRCQALTILAKPTDAPSASEGGKP